MYLVIYVYLTGNKYDDVDVLILSFISSMAYCKYFLAYSNTCVFIYT